MAKILVKSKMLRNINRRARVEFFFLKGFTNKSRSIGLFNTVTFLSKTQLQNEQD